MALTNRVTISRPHAAPPAPRAHAVLNIVIIVCVHIKRKIVRASAPPNRAGGLPVVA